MLKNRKILLAALALVSHAATAGQVDSSLGQLDPSTSFGNLLTGGQAGQTFADRYAFTTNAMVTLSADLLMREGNLRARYRQLFPVRRGQHAVECGRPLLCQPGLRADTRTGQPGDHGGGPGTAGLGRATAPEKPGLALIVLPVARLAFGQPLDGLRHPAQARCVALGLVQPACQRHVRLKEG